MQQELTQTAVRVWARVAAVLASQVLHSGWQGLGLLPATVGACWHEVPCLLSPDAILGQSAAVPDVQSTIMLMSCRGQQYTPLNCPWHTHSRVIGTCRAAGPLSQLQKHIAACEDVTAFRGQAAKKAIATSMDFN